MIFYNIMHQSPTIMQDAYCRAFSYFNMKFEILVDLQFLLVLKLRLCEAHMNKNAYKCCAKTIFWNYGISHTISLCKQLDYIT